MPSNLIAKQRGYSVTGIALSRIVDVHEEKSPVCRLAPQYGLSQFSGIAHVSPPTFGLHRRKVLGSACLPPCTQLWAGQSTACFGASSTGSKLGSVPSLCSGQLARRWPLFLNTCKPATPRKMCRALLLRAWVDAWVSFLKGA